MVFNPLYKQAENVPVILSIDLGFIEKTGKSSQFKKPEQIFKYSTELEEKIIREYEKRNPPEPTKPRFDSVLQPSLAAKPASPPQHVQPVVEKTKIDEFDPAATPQSPWDVLTSVKDDIDDLSKAMEQSRISTSNPTAIKGDSSSPPAVVKDYDEIASKYIPDALASDKMHLAVAIQEAEQMNLQEMDALRGYYLFQDKPEQLVPYLDNYAALSDLGFGQEKIDLALLTSKNNREEALEQLMNES